MVREAEVDKYFEDITHMIGSTPVLKTQCFDIGVCELFLKLENQNPGGSIKDRMALFMIQGAEKRGRLKPGGTIVEATAGNTGIGLSLVSAKKGYKLILVIPDKMSKEKIDLLKAMGAAIVMTRSDVKKGHPEYYQDLAHKIAQETPNSLYIDQFNNPDNPLAHYMTTGPEIWEQMENDVDAIAFGVGSGGTSGGLTRYFKEVKPDISFILADPAGSVLKAHVEGKSLPKPGSWYVEGIGEDFIPAMADFSLVRKAYEISDKESFHTARKLLKEEGISAGSSSGTIIAAAVRYAKEQTRKKRILAFVCDGADKYLSKMYSDVWMKSKGLI